MNITKARKIVREHPYGYYQVSATEMYERCPECRADVPTTVLAWVSEPARSKARKQSMIEHLMEEH